MSWFTQVRHQAGALLARFGARLTIWGCYLCDVDPEPFVKEYRQ